MALPKNVERPNVPHVPCATPPYQPYRPYQPERKENTDAISQGQVEQSGLDQHQDRDQSRGTTEAGDSNRAVEGGPVEQNQSQEKEVESDHEMCLKYPSTHTDLKGNVWMGLCVLDWGHAGDHSPVWSKRFY